MKICSSILDTIGNTPLVDLSRIAKEFGVEGRILAKIEYMNPSASKKDRIALYMIEEAERSGRLKPGQEVIEITSGNTGNGLAVVCAVKGYKFVAAMSKGNSVERMKMIKAMGAELLLADQAPNSKKGFVTGEDLDLVEKAAKEYAERTGALLINQFYNPDNNKAHAATTAAELWEQTDGKLDYFVDFGGTGGTFDGTASGLKGYNKEIKCFIAEPALASVYGDTLVTNPAHRIQGGGYAKEIVLVDRANVDGSVPVTDEEAIETTRMLAREEGIFAGFSSGANVMAAVKLLRGEAKGKTIVLLINDTGLKYLSTDLFDFQI